MGPGNTITGGAVCDLWSKDANPSPFVIKESETPPWEHQVEHCDGCAYLNGEVCLLKNKEALNKCNRFEETEEVTVHADEEGEQQACRDCDYSQYNENVAWCMYQGHAIEEDGWCADWKHEAVVEDHNTCIRCKHSYYGEEGVPFCNIDGRSIVSEVLHDTACEEHFELEEEDIQNDVK
jgi:hypothetical protein